MPFRIVLDTNVVISGLLWRGTPHQVLKAVYKGDFIAFASIPLLDELFRTLSTPKLRRNISSTGYTPEELRALYESFINIVVPAPLDEIIVIADPSDDIVIHTALAAGADFIITGNHHLLDLVSYSGISIVSPSNFLRTI
jgi:putative PIN family toxin of toxin-antitoxin system